MRAIADNGRRLLYFPKTSRDIRTLVSALVDNLDGTNDLTYPPEDGRPDPDNTARYALTEGTVLIMDAKVKMCDILLLISNLRLDYRITDVLRMYAALDPNAEGGWEAATGLDSLMNEMDPDSAKKTITVTASSRSGTTLDHV